MATQYQDIVIRVDAKGAVSVLNQAGEAVKKFDSATQAATSGLNKFEREVQKIGSASVGGVSKLASEFGNLGKVAGISAGAVILAGTAVVTALGKVAQQGERLADAEKAFNRLAKAAGQSGEQLLSNFGSALDYTVPKMEQMQILSKMLSAGLDPKDFDLYARAARSMGEAFGSDAKDGLNRMYQAIVGGQTESLKHIGIMVSAESSSRKWARANANLGKSFEDVLQRMTPEAKLIALQEEATEKLKEKYSALGQATVGAGDAFTQVQIAAKGGLHELTKGIGTNEELSAVFQELASVIRGLPWQAVSDGLSSIVSHLIPAKDECEKLADAASRAWTELKNLASETFSVQIQVDAIDQLSWADSPALKFAKLIADKFKPAKQAVAEVSAEGQTQVDVWGDLSKGVQLFDHNLKAATKSSKKLLEPEDSKTKQRAAEKLEESIKGIREQIEKIYKTGSYGSNLNAFAQIAGEETKDNVAEIAENMAKVAEALIRAGQPASQVSAALNEAAEGARKLREFSDQTAVQFVNSRDTSSTKGPWDGVGKELSAEITSSLIDGVKNAKNSSDWANVIGDLGGSIGGTIGSSIGESLGGEGLGGEILGEVGGAVGSAIGSVIVDGITEALGNSDSKSTKARKAADQYIGDILRKSNVVTIVNGELQRISDLTFKGSTDAAFKALPAQAQSAFSAVGDAWTQVMAEAGVDVENLSVSLTNVFSSNVGGSIADLRVLIKALGKDAAELAEALMIAFNQGKMSAQELMNELQGLQSTMSAGIPEAVGAVDVAFKRTQEAGWSGGAVLTDAIASVAVEAMELGAKTFPELQAIMVNTFGISAEAAANFINGCTAAGIKSLEDLRAASDATLVAVAANMEAGSKGQAMTYKPISFDPPSTKGFGGASSAMKNTAKDAKDAAKEIRDLVEASGAYSDILSKVAAHEMTVAEEGKALKKLYGEMAKAQKAMTSAENKLDEYLSKHKGASVQSRQLAQLENQVDRTTNAFNKLKDASKTAEEKAMDAFLAGRKDFADAAKQGGLSHDILGFGNVKGAVNSLMGLGTKGGALSVESIKAIGAEAEQAGKTTLADIIQFLQNQGMDIGTLQKFQAGAEKAGLESVSDFLNISDADALKFLSTLQEIKFPFAETSKAISDTLAKLDKLRNSKVNVDVNLRIKASYDNEIAKKYGPIVNFQSAYASSQGPSNNR